MGLINFGRQVIYTDTDVINEQNVLDELQKAMRKHTNNRSDIEYLYQYYKGNQPILQRKPKYPNDTVCNNIVENRANEIVSFKVGYLMGEPVQYVNRGGDELTEDINILNDYVFAEDKAAKDKELADWFTICGTAYRMVLPDNATEQDESPFEIYTLDPRCAFVVYHSGLGNKPKMGVKYVVKQDGTVVYSVYTDKQYFEIEQPGVNGVTLFGAKIIKADGHILGDIPIIEYPANNARLGAFEIVLPLLDAMNLSESCRLDGLVKFVQSLLVLKGIDLEDEEFARLLNLGGIAVPPDGDVKYIAQELNQTQTQTLVDYMYQTVLTICGMPSQSSGNTNDSSNNGAVILKNGWSSAEARAKDSELMFKMSEKQFLKLAIRIANAKRDMNLRLSNIEIRFTRRNYENILSKAQVLTTMLANPMIHPRLAFAHCGMFVDPELAYSQSMEWAAQEQAREEQALADYAQRETERLEAEAVAS